MKITKKLKKEIADYCISNYPNESGGIVCRGEFTPIKNVHRSPKVSYAPEKGELYYSMDDIETYVHSHPANKKTFAGVSVPSPFDMEMALELKKPEIIAVVGKNILFDIFSYNDDKNRPKLMSRPFRWQVTDCYSLIRDWLFMARGIDLPNFSRDFYEVGGTDFYDVFQGYGFEEIDINDVKPFDIIVATMNKKFFCHVYGVVPGNKLIHHSSTKKIFEPESLSRTDSMEYVLSHKRALGRVIAARYTK